MNTVTLGIHRVSTVSHQMGLFLNDSQLRRLVEAITSPRFVSQKGRYILRKDRGVIIPPNSVPDTTFALFTGFPGSLADVYLEYDHHVVEGGSVLSINYNCNHKMLQLWHVPLNHRLCFTIKKTNEFWVFRNQGGKIDLWSKAEETKKTTKGKEAEHMFVSAWSKSRDYTAYPATEKEDKEQETDAWLCSRYHRSIRYRIQVKSGKGYDPYSFFRRGLVLVVIDVDKDTSESIIAKTLYAVSRFRKVFIRPQINKCR